MTEPSQNEKAVAAWMKIQEDRQRQARKVDWASMTDDGPIDPKDLKVELGPMLTEEQFKRYCQSKGIAPTIVKTKK